MRHWATGMRMLCVVLACGLAVGCNESREPEDATVYDPELDAPPTNLPVNPDPALLDDQATVARPVAAGTTGTGGAETGGAPSGGDPATQAIRNAMGQVFNAAATGQWEGIAGFVTQESQDAVRTAGAAMTRLDTAAKALEAAVQQRIEGEPPQTLSQLLQRGLDGGPFFVRFANMTTENIVVEVVDDETAVVRDNAGLNLSVRKSDEKWLLVLTDGQRRVLQALAALADVQATAANELTTVFSGGAVSASNAASVIQEKIAPVVNAQQQLKIAMAGG